MFGKAARALRDPALQIVVAATALGGLFMLVGLAPLLSPIQIMNSVTSVPSTNGATTTLDLQAGHYYLVWRTHAPNHAVWYSWRITIDLETPSGQSVLHQNYTWDEEVRCSPNNHGYVTCSIWSTFSFVDLSLPAGPYALRVLVHHFSATDGGPRPEAALHFNEPNLARPGHNVMLAVVTAFTIAPSALWFGIIRRRRRVIVAREASRAVVAPRVVDESPPNAPQSPAEGKAP